MGANAKPRSAKPFTSETAREAGKASAAARRAKAEARTEAAEQNALTFRQRLGVSLSKLTQTDLDARVKQARPSELVRFADQAFGKPTEAEADTPKDEGLAALTREQRATLRAMLLEGDESAPSESEAPPEH